MHVTKTSQLSQLASQKCLIPDLASYNPCHRRLATQKSQQIRCLLPEPIGHPASAPSTTDASNTKLKPFYIIYSIQIAAGAPCVQNAWGLPSTTSTHHTLRHAATKALLRWKQNTITTIPQGHWETGVKPLEQQNKNMPGSAVAAHGLFSRLRERAAAKVQIKHDLAPP